MTMRSACAVAITTALTVAGVSFADDATQRSSGTQTTAASGVAKKRTPAKKRGSAKKPKKAVSRGKRGLTGAHGAQGAQGLSGPAGDDGRQGPTGLTGLQGPAGPPGADGADGANGTTAVTRLDTGAATDNSVTGGAFESLRAVGSFTKATASSRVKLTWNGHLRGTGLPVVDWFCDFQLRIDAAQPTGNGGQAVLYSTGVAQNDAPAGATAFFDGLAAGSHAVSIWVKGTTGGLSCEINHGAPTDEIFAEEMPA